MSFDAVLLRSVTARLAAAGCVAADAEALEILGAVRDHTAALSAVARREHGEPLAWIVGHVDFAGVRVHVAPGVYVPRVQSEELARRAAAALPDGGCAVDLCTGAGAIAAHLAAAVPSALVLGVDLDRRAAICARSNGVVALAGDLAAPLHADHGVDVVTAVAPYVPADAIGFLPADVRRFEPALALDGGADGLRIVRRVVADAARLLRRGGRLMVELGGNQDVALQATLAEHGFAEAEAWSDEDGDLRGLAARLG